MEDRGKYVELFRAEALEHLESLARGLLHLEEQPDDTEGLRELLRNAHTIKGSARMVGLASIGEVAHRMEDLLRAFERGEVTIAVAAVDLLLEATDAIRTAVDGIGPGVVPDLPVQDLCTRIQAAARGEGAGTRPAPTPAGLGKALAGLLDDDDPPAPAPKPVRKKSGRSKRAAAAGGSPRGGEAERSGTAATPATASTATAAPAPAAAATQNAERGTRNAAPPAPATASSNGDTARRAPAADAPVRETMRVEVARLDELTDLSGELVIIKSRLENRAFIVRDLLARALELARPQRAARPAAERLRELEALLTQDARLFAEEFGNDVSTLDRLVGDVQGRTLALRMLPVALIFEPYRRTVRDLKQDLGKEVELKIQGADTVLDRQLIQAVNPALLHLVRNAVDHGIEPPDARERAGKPRQGTIELRAFQRGANVVIEVSDDGRGLDPREVRSTAVARKLVTAEEAARMSDRDALRLIFRHGFSTSKIITDISGRGIGMSVVFTTLKDLKGDVHVESEPGRFTRFTLSLPLTLTTTDALLVEAGREIVAIPAGFVLATLRVERSALAVEGGTTVLQALDRVFPVVELHRFLDLPERRQPVAPGAKATVVVVQLRDERLGCIVDRVLRFQEIVVRSLGGFLGRLPLAAGATILRKGDPAVILNVFDLFADARTRLAQAQPDATPAPTRKRRVLVVDDSLTTRTIERSILEQHGYQVEVAASGEEALARLAAGTYDLVVSDVEMPGITGFELTARLRADPAHRDLPIIIVTSLARDTDRQRGVDVGAQAYIVKGAFNQQVLLDTVRSLIG